MSLSFICLPSLSPSMCTACEGYELSHVVSSPNYGLESILCGPSGLVECLYTNTVTKLKPTFSRKGLLEEDCAICRMHFSKGFNKVERLDSKQVRLNPVNCFPGTDSSPESILGDYSGWCRRDQFVQSD